MVSELTAAGAAALAVGIVLFAVTSIFQGQYASTWGPFEFLNPSQREIAHFLDTLNVVSTSLLVGGFAMLIVGVATGARGERTIVGKERQLIKEVVMIPCSHCGNLMSQTSRFCPNCGAAREKKEPGKPLF